MGSLYVFYKFQIKTNQSHQLDLSKLVLNYISYNFITQNKDRAHLEIDRLTTDKFFIKLTQRCGFIITDNNYKIIFDNKLFNKNLLGYDLQHSLKNNFQVWVLPIRGANLLLGYLILDRATPGFYFNFYMLLYNFFISLVILFFLRYHWDKSLIKILKVWHKLVLKVGIINGLDYNTGFFTHIKNKLFTPKIIVKQVNNSTLITYMLQDLKTPLNSILGFSEILMEEYGINTLEENLNLIEKIKIAGNKLGHMLQNSIGLGCNSGVCLEKINLTQLINTMVSNFTLPPKKNLNLQIMDQQIFINADYEKLTLILYNLMDNAIKFCFSEVEVALKIQNQNANLFITDNGVGMSMDQINKILTGNYIINSNFSNSQRETSFGIGLCLVSKYCQQLKIPIFINSKMAVGTQAGFTQIKLLLSMVNG